MALTCPHCGRAGSSKQTIPPGTKATARCPGCGLNFSSVARRFPFRFQCPLRSPLHLSGTSIEASAMFRNHPIGFCFCILITVMMATTAFSSHEPVAIWLALIVPVFLLRLVDGSPGHDTEDHKQPHNYHHGVLSRETTGFFTRTSEIFN